MTDNARAQFVESIPIGMEDIAEGVVSTADALIRLTKAASETIDLTAQGQRRLQVFKGNVEIAENQVALAAVVEDGGAVARITK